MKIKLVNARVAFAHGLFKAEAFEEGATPKFGADFLIGPDTKCFEIKADKTAAPITMKEAELTVAKEAWKDKAQAMLDDFEGRQKSYRNGNKRTDKNGEVYDGYEGVWYVTAKSPTRPGLFGADRRPLTEEDGVIYSGCYVDVIFDLYANTKPKTRGIFAGLTGVQFRADGEAFGGGRPASADDFDDISDGAGAAGLL